MNRKHIAKLIEDSIINKLYYNGSDLLFFVDDTGVEKRSEAQPVFALGGCALRGAAYDSLKPAWMTLRQIVFRLSDGEVFHATDILPRLSAEQLAPVTEFLGESTLSKFAYVVHQQSSIDPYIGELEAVTLGISSAADRLFLNEAVPHARWIIEHSDRLCRAMVTTSQYPYFHGDQDTIVSQGFMKKSAKEPGLEISDLIMFIVGKHYRDAASGRQIYNCQMAAMFSDERVGICHEALFVGPNIWINTLTGESGTGSILSVRSTRVSGPPRKGADARPNR